jgi:hypothetical protein
MHCTDFSFRYVVYEPSVSSLTITNAAQLLDPLSEN